MPPPPVQRHQIIQRIRGTGPHLGIPAVRTGGQPVGPRHNRRVLEQAREADPCRGVAAREVETHTGGQANRGITVTRSALHLHKAEARVQGGLQGPPTQHVGNGTIMQNNSTMKGTQNLTSMQNQRNN